MIRVVTSPFRLTALALRTLGFKRVVWLALGAAVAVLVTPVTGPELRRRITLAIARTRAGAEPTIEERVRTRLADNPRTWHLPQPEVVAVRDDDGVSWRIILAGEVADAQARADLTQTAAAVTGVVAVDDRIRVAGEDA